MLFHTHLQIQLCICIIRINYCLGRRANRINGSSSTFAGILLLNLSNGFFSFDPGDVDIALIPISVLVEAIHIKSTEIAEQRINIHAELRTISIRVIEITRLQVFQCILSESLQLLEVFRIQSSIDLLIYTVDRVTQECYSIPDKVLVRFQHASNNGHLDIEKVLA